MTTPMKVHGADLSHHNSTPDLKKAKAAGLLWLYHKTTEGETYVDPTYAARRKMADDANLPFGGYHFARPTISNINDADDEARYFMKILRPKAGDLVPALDFEVSSKMSEAWCKKFMAEVERLLKLQDLQGKPVHYGPDDFGKDYNYLRWVPRYNNTNTRPTVPWDIWQFSNGQYGLPHSFPGVGAVDLNTMRDGVSLGDFRLRATRTPTFLHVKMAHFSMQFSDTLNQKKVDAGRIFSRAKKLDYAWLTGTEAGHADTAAALKEEALANGYAFWVAGGTDSWFAVKKDRIKGKWDTYYSGPVVDGVAHRWADKGVCAVTWDDVELGTLTVISSHYLTKGRPDAKDPDYKVHVEDNRKIANAIADYAIEAGKGNAKVFFGGDTNIVDRDSDVFFNRPLTTAWDELGHWENTGHGNIDVIATYDRDVSVSAVSCKALTDAELPLNTDHYGVEAEYQIRITS